MTDWITDGISEGVWDKACVHDDTVQCTNSVTEGASTTTESSSSVTIITGIYIDNVSFTLCLSPSSEQVLKLLNTLEQALEHLPLPVTFALQLLSGLLWAYSTCTV